MKIVVHACEADARLAPLNVSRRAGTLRLGAGTVLTRIARQISVFDPNAVLITDSVNKSVEWSAGDVFSCADQQSIRSLEGESEIIVLRGISYLDDAGLKHFVESGAQIWTSVAQTGRPGTCLGIRMSPDSFLSGASDSNWLDTMAENECCERSFPIVYPWHLIEANVAVLEAMNESSQQGIIDPGSEISGLVHIGKGTRIRCGTVIEGPAYIGAGTIVGPNAYIRPLSVIGNDCHLGHGFEMYDSVIDDGTTAKHRSYVGHSVVGRDVNIGCGFVTSDYRHDGSEHTTLVAGVKVATGRRKLGAFLGDRVRTGIQSSLYPGRKLWPDTHTLPGAVVRADLELE